MRTVLSNAGGALAEGAMNGALVNDLQIPSFWKAFLKLGPYER